MPEKIMNLEVAGEDIEADRHATVSAELRKVLQAQLAEEAGTLGHAGRVAIHAMTGVSTRTVARLTVSRPVTP